jgi:hypothetical protein
MTATCLAILTCLAPAAADAQFGGSAVAFRNEMKTPVIVQGYTFVGKMPKRGMAIVVPPGKTLLDINVPVGIRVYTVYDANMPSVVLIKDFPVPIKGMDLSLVIRGVPPKVTLEPAP